MRAISVLVALAAVALGAYFYFKTMPKTDEGTAPTQAIDLTGVRMDLLQIAQAERTFTAMNSRCATMDELISSRSLTMQLPERNGYTYSVRCSESESGFTVTARHAPAPEGSPIRYPTFAVDQGMEIHEVQ